MPTPLDPEAWATAAIILSLVTFLAAWLPARRACRVDPAIVSMPK